MGDTPLMRIGLIVHHELDRHSGAPGLTMRLDESFRRQGHECVVFSYDNLPTRRLASLAPTLFAAYLLSSRRTRQLRDVDVIDATTGDGWLLYARLRRRRNRPALVTRSHGLEHAVVAATRREAASGHIRLRRRYFLYSAGWRLLEVTRSIKQADVVLLSNQADRMYVIDRMDVDPKRCVVFRNGVPAEFLALAPPEETAVDETLRIAQVGTFIERKGIDYSVPAYIELLRARPHLEIGFIGTGVDDVAVLARFPPDVRQRVRVVPRYEHETLPGLLSDYQILVLPSLAEGVPVCLAEAMACGLAPVVTAIPGSTEIVESERNGLTVPVADTASIVAALGRLDDDRTLLHRLRVAAHGDAQSYGWDRVAAEQISYYESALALKGGDQQP